MLAAPTATLRMFALAVAAVACASGCVGEASLGFKGAVVTAAPPGAAYEAQPATGEPVPGAELTVCMCSKPCACEPTASGRHAKVGPDGSYVVPEMVFGGMIGVDNIFVVRADAPGYETVRFTLNYGKDRAEGRPFLNFRMAKSVKAAGTGSLRLDAAIAEALAPRDPLRKFALAARQNALAATK